MAGLDEFLNKLKDANNMLQQNNNKFNRGYILNNIIDRINEAVNIPEEFLSGKPDGNEADKKELSKEEQEAKKIEQRTADSNNAIMKRSSDKKSSSSSSAGSQDIFNFNMTDDAIVQGFIFSEILGKPKSRRRRAR